MKMDWETLLDELWSYAASDPKELESTIRACLKGHSSEGLLQAISLLLSQAQHVTAKTLLAEFMKSHQSADDIRRRLELILHFKKHRGSQLLSIKSKQRSKEQLIKHINDLVASGKFQAAESILLEAIEAFEEPDALSLLSRVYMLQRRPIDGAMAMQRALLLRRKQQVFIESESEETTDGLPTDSDLAFIRGSAADLHPLENPTTPTNQVLTETVDDSLTDIQNVASQYPALRTDDWWDCQSEETPSDASTRLDQPGSDEKPATAPDATDDCYDAEHGGTEPRASKPILKLARPRKEKEAGDGLAKVKVFTKTGRALPPVLPAGSVTPEPSGAGDVPEEPTVLPAIEVPAFKPKSHEETSDEFDVYEDQDLDIEHSEPIGLNTPHSIEPSPVLDESDDDIDFENDLPELSIFEPEEGAGDGAHSDVEDFRELEDEYAAYAFDPDEVFEGSETAFTDADDWLTGKVSREERALQKAAELIGKANWPLSTLSLVQQIFVMSGWGATRLALEREIEKGLTPDELILAAHIKVIWAENDMYWIAFDRTGSSRLSHQILSWPTALLIVRSYESLPQVEEIEVFLEHLFTSWYESSTLRRAFKAFGRYLWFRVANLQGCLPASQPFDFGPPHDLPLEEYSDLGLYDTLEYEKTESLRAFGVFQTKHPQEPSCYFTDKPITEFQSPINAENRFQTKGDATTGGSETEYNTVDDYVEEPLPQWSALPLPRTFAAPGTKAPSESMDT